MIPTVSNVQFTSNLRYLGNASQDFLNIELVLKVSKSLEVAVEEFIMTYDPKKFYRGIQGISTKTIGLNINTYA
ncbi:hypothetical protein [Thermobrachium celere]|uniref:Uncharacterized protein n=1 Tax=Thermobrachium celere DSM 8682 TaxID=941824 RepID=R7RQL9_9CLOT|nr:hypothetical protein [Thermobrachium celere]GFR36179.1 hypothetical protein TCEA9_19910 [Thermobrachium celere]CDF57525.1 hypothetical protein TCEL_01439 [Thermobrachium celere DSM 8682]